MKKANLQKQAENQISGDLIFTIDLRTTVLEALSSVDGARQMCMAAGQMLNEAKDKCNHGEFLDILKVTIPEISHETATTWMRAARNIAKALPAPSIDIESVSLVLHTPDDQLTPVQLKYKQDWFDFTEGKTIKDACAGVFVDGDEAHRVDRAVNGKTKGGAGDLEKRKDCPRLVAEKLKAMAENLKLWPGMSETAKLEMKAVVRAAIMGEDITVRGKIYNFGWNGKGSKPKTKMWPREFSAIAIEALKERLNAKGGEGEA